MRYLIARITGILLVSLMLASAAFAIPDGKKEAVIPTVKDHPLDELWSGYYFAQKETRAFQDDDFDNPAGLWLEQGEELWSAVEGAKKKSCKYCHNDATASMKGKATRYPVYYGPWKKLINLEQRINLCRTKFMKAPAWKWESDELLAMTIYVAKQSKDMPTAIVLNDKTRPFFEQGKKHYYSRRGQLDMACFQCHENYFGRQLRSNLLSQGHVNGFPTFRLKWQKPGSLHRRFKGCNVSVRAEPYSLGSDEYVNLEYYVKWRGNGLPIETPAVRN